MLHSDSGDSTHINDNVSDYEQLKSPGNKNNNDPDNDGGEYQLPDNKINSGEYKLSKKQKVYHSWPVLLCALIFIPIILYAIWTEKDVATCNTWSNTQNYDCINSQNITTFFKPISRNMCANKCAYITLDKSCCKYSEKDESCWIIQPYVGIINGTSFVTLCSSIYNR